MRAVVGLLLAVAIVAAPASRAATPVAVMLLDGESGGPYHKWQLTTPVLKKILTRQVSSPSPSCAPCGVAAFAPGFVNKVVVMNYGAPRRTLAGVDRIIPGV